MHAKGALGTAIFEPVLKKMEVGESLLDFSSEGTAWVALTNPSHLTRVLRKGTTIGDAFGAEPVDPGDVLVGDCEPPAVRCIPIQLMDSAEALEDTDPNSLLTSALVEMSQSNNTCRRT